MKAYKTFIYLNDREWGNSKMEQAAIEYATSHPEKRPLICNVHEHGGWWLQYYFNDSLHRCKPIVVGTANDSAKFDAYVNELRRQLGEMMFEPFEEVRR